MNSFFKTITVSFTLLLTSLCYAQEMNPRAIARHVIQQDIEHFQKQSEFTRGSTRTAEATVINVRYKLTAMTLIPLGLLFTFECSDRDIEEEIKTKLNIK